MKYFEQRNGLVTIARGNTCLAPPIVIGFQRRRFTRNDPPEFLVVDARGGLRSHRVRHLRHSAPRWIRISARRKRSSIATSPVAPLSAIRKHSSASRASSPAVVQVILSIRFQADNDLNELIVARHAPRRACHQFPNRALGVARRRVGRHCSGTRRDGGVNPGNA